MDANAVNRCWLSLAQERRREIAAEMLERIDPDLRGLLVEALARAMKVRSLTLHQRSVPKLVPDLALHFTRLSFESRMLAVAAMFQGHERMSDFNTAIGFDPEDPGSGSPAGFRLSDLDAYRRDHGVDLLRLALSFVVATSRNRAVEIAAAHALRELELELDASRGTSRGLGRGQPGRLMQEPADDVAERVVGTPGRDAAVGSSVPCPDDGGQVGEGLGPDDVAANAPEIRPDAGEPSDDPGVDSAEGAPNSDLRPADQVWEEAGESCLAASESDEESAIPDDWGLTDSRDEELDRLVIRAVVAHASGEFGAMRADEIRRLVDSLIALNTGRFRSYFHLGFSDALLVGEAQETESGINQPRRAWYLCGFLLGKRRQVDDDRFLQGIDALSESDLEALRSPMARGAIQKLGPSVVEAAFACRRYALAADWALVCGAFDKAVTDRATILALREPSDQPSENQALLGGCMQIRHAAAERLDAPRILEPLQELACSLVGSLWQSGGIAAARGMEPPAGFSSAGAEGVWIEALLRFGLKRPEELVPTDLPQLEQLAVHFIAVEAGDDGLPAYAVLRDLYGWLQRSATSVGPAARREAATLLGRAYDCSAALRVDAARRARHALVPSLELAEIIELLGAILACLAGDDTEIRLGVSRVDRWLRDRGRLPRPILKQVLENAILAGSADVASLHRGLVQRYGAEAFDLADLGEVASNPGAREAFMALLEDAATLAPEKRWSLSRVIGRAVARGAADTELARRCGDELCEITESRPQQFGAELMLELVDDVWREVYEEEELESRLISVAGLRGEYGEVGQLLQRQLSRALAEGALPLACDCVEILDGRGLGNFVSGEQRAWLRSQVDSAAAGEEMPSDRPVRILFVGGNEIQARWDAEIRGQVAARAPGVGVEFIHSGWSSNWGVFVDEVERKVDGCSAIVLMRFVRTILGEKVRRLASERGKPWIACSGHGRASIERAIIEAARVARALRIRAS